MRKIYAVLAVLVISLIILPPAYHYLTNNDETESYLSDKSENKSGNVETNGDQIVASAPLSSSPRPAIGDESTSEGTYNWVYEWDDSTMENYNSYAFVVGMTYGTLTPGDLSGRPTDVSVGELSASELSDYIINDLKSLGFTDVKEVSDIYEPSEDEHIIAFRRGYDDNGDYKDFNFMTLDSSGYWLHKPGDSAVSIYRSTDISSAWPAENYDSEGWQIDDSFSYNGTISYFAFQD